jgi:hypothetical protein
MTRIQRTATIIRFRSKQNITFLAEAVRVRLVVITFKGTVLGTTNNDDVIAAFSSDADAMRFLDRYFEGDLDGPIGAYVINEATI